MYKKWAIPILAALVMLAFVTARAAGGVDICLRATGACPERLVPMLDAEIFPRKLPATEYAPIKWHLTGKFSTGEAHPPALREMELDVDKDLRLHANSYPVCRAGRAIRQRNSEGALETCRGALLGEGRAHIEIASPEGSPTLLATRLLVFNGAGKEATPRLLIHGFLAKPAPTPLVASVTLQRRGGGLHTVVEIPPIADGLGSVVDFELDVGATFLRGRHRSGYFEARCPDEVFKMNLKKIVFKNEANTPGEAASTNLKGSLAVPCTPKG